VPSQSAADAGAGIAAALEHAQLSPAGRDLVTASPTIAEAVERLIDAGLLADAVEVLAHGLAGPDAVSWVCRCANATRPGDLAEADRIAAESAAEWTRSQRDETRRAAMKQAERAGLRTPEAWAAAAAFYSGESLSEPHLPVVGPAPNLAGLTVASAVTLAAVRRRPELADSRLRQFLQIGLGIAAAADARRSEELAR
jgi:hypothetical protein